MAQFFGVMLIVVGLLLAALCGLCTLVVAGGSLAAPGDPQGYGGGGMVGIALLLGGVPTLLGLGMIFAGVMLLRSGRKPPPDVPKTFE
jgi:hypothetical protein